jgi:hypothetical protein
MGRSQDGAVPVGHHQVLRVVQSVGACLCATACQSHVRPEKRETRDVRLPAPRPFSPFSSSSSRRKFLGTLAVMVYCLGLP